MMTWYYYHCWPLWLLFDFIRGLHRGRVRRKNALFLRERMAYLEDCKSRGVSPYEGLDAFLGEQEARDHTSRQKRRG